MARRVVDLQHGIFRRFTKNIQIVKRELRELAPESSTSRDLLIRGPDERRVVMSYLLARKRDERTGSDQHVQAFFRDKNDTRILRAVMARIPPMSDGDA